MDKVMREKQIPLFALESQEPACAPLTFWESRSSLRCAIRYSSDPRLKRDSAACQRQDRRRSLRDRRGALRVQSEPLAEFFDLFYIGEGETVYDELLTPTKSGREAGNRESVSWSVPLRLKGSMCLRFTMPSTKRTHTVVLYPNNPHAPEKVRKQAVMNVTDAPYPMKPVVPFIKATQDRVVLEIQRGCIRGCRFCQAGMIYALQESGMWERLKEYARTMLINTGHEEISLSSLSSSDYSDLKELVNFLIDEFKDKGINISLPSLRIDAFSLDVMSKVQDIRKSSLTFAPEAGSQRMRNVINKG